jgi:DNA-binding response OmpR family regulator
MLCARKLLPPAMTSVPIPNRQTILVADDERVIADTLKLILSQHGFDAAVAYDGNSAIEMARRFSPQLFLCDVIMPDINGVEVAIQVRAILPECRVLLFSGQADVLDLLVLARLRDYKFDVVVKPIHPSELLARLRSLI